MFFRGKIALVNLLFDCRITLFSDTDLRQPLYTSLYLPAMLLGTIKFAFSKFLPLVLVIIVHFTLIISNIFCFSAVYHGLQKGALDSPWNTSPFPSMPYQKTDARSPMTACICSSPVNLTLIYANLFTHLSCLCTYQLCYWGPSNLLPANFLPLVFL